MIQLQNNLSIILLNQEVKKNNRKYIHSLYENRYKYDISACGTYITKREIVEAIKD
jgi:hypothetical protein